MKSVRQRANHAAATESVQPPGTVELGWIRLLLVAIVTEHLALRQLRFPPLPGPRPDQVRLFQPRVDVIDLRPFPRATMPTWAVLPYPCQATILRPFVLILPLLLFRVGHASNKASLPEPSKDARVCCILPAWKTPSPLATASPMPCSTSSTQKQPSTRETP